MCKEIYVILLEQYGGHGNVGNGEYHTQTQTYSELRSSKAERSHKPVSNPFVSSLQC
jgi:hypothetical protein